MDYHIVCDISRHNGEIDFKKMRLAGAVGVAIRATVGDYYTDPRFYENWRGAGEAGLYRTAYHVVRPRYSPVSQFKRFKDVVGNRRPDFGLIGWVADNECTNGQNKQVITDAIWYCLDQMSDHAGVNACNYTRGNWWNNNVNPSTKWDQWLLWIARYSKFLKQPWPDGDDPYNVKPHSYDDWAMWQWSADANLRGREFGAMPEPGAPEPSMDLNRAKLSVFDGADLPTPPPEPQPSEPEPPNDEYNVVVTAHTLNVRSDPHVRPNNKLSWVRQGWPLTVIGDEGDWLEVRVPEYTAWVHGAYVKRV